MKDKDAKVFVSSVRNISKQLEYYGDAKLENINLLRLIYKYAEYCVTYSQVQRLDSMVATLQREDDNICMEFTSTKGYADVVCVPVVAIGVGTSNQPPIMTDGAVTLEDPDLIYSFTYNDLFGGYSDDAGGVAGEYLFISLPTTGTLKYNGIDVVIGTLYTDHTLLTYTRFEESAYVSTFDYVAYDNDTQLPLASNTATMTVTVDEILIVNEPATVGDRAQYAGNRVTTVFTIADFTTEAIAPYFDPENNDLDAIRIDEISDANTGVYYYFANPVLAGQVISANELDNGAFYHVAPDANSVTTDSFNASVRDSGSMIWVQ